jgi:ribosomal protein S18 acetylase RimI-like enzyme
VKVRRAVPADARAIAEVHVRSWQSAYRDLMPHDLLDGLSVADREANWSHALTAGSRTIFAAETDGRLAGFCALSEPTRDQDEPDGVAEIGAIYVEPAQSRRGVGTELMNTALEHLTAGGWTEATLWVLRDNQPAIDFYTRLGFVPDGSEELYERSRAVGIRLRRALGAHDSH